MSTFFVLSYVIITMSRFRQILDFGSVFVRTVCALHLFTSEGYELCQTEGASMLPTLAVQNDFCVVNKTLRNGRGIEMGDMVVARKPTAPEQLVCKRITGMPGDVVLIDPSSGSVNGIREEYEGQAMSESMREEMMLLDKRYRGVSSVGGDPYDQYIVVPDGHVWVTGDNLSDSIDSRTYSAVPMGLITGKIVGGLYVPHLGFRSLGSVFKDA